MGTLSLIYVFNISSKKCKNGNDIFTFVLFESLESITLTCIYAIIWSPSDVPRTVYLLPLSRRISDVRLHHSSYNILPHHITIHTLYAHVCYTCACWYKSWIRRGRHLGCSGLQQQRYFFQVLHSVIYVFVRSMFCASPVPYALST